MRLRTGPAAPARALHTLNLNGHLTLSPGRECTVKGLGRCRYSGHVNADGSIDVYEATAGACRSVMPQRVTTVHRTRKLRLR